MLSTLGRMVGATDKDNMIQVLAVSKTECKLIINKEKELLVKSKDVDAWMLGYPASYCFPYLTKEEQDELDNA